MKDLKIVRGNDFCLIVPIRRILFGPVNEYGERVPVSTRIDLNDCSILSVNIVNEFEEKQPIAFSVTHGDESSLIVKIKGDRICEGWYGVEVRFTYDGRRSRSYERRVFKIVENNGKSFVDGSMYAGEMSYQVDTMWTLYAHESYPFFELDTRTMELVQHGTVENGNMYIDENGKLCMSVAD